MKAPGEWVQGPPARCKLCTIVAQPSLVIRSPQGGQAFMCPRCVGIVRAAFVAAGPAPSAKGQMEIDAPGMPLPPAPPAVFAELPVLGEEAVYEVTEEFVRTMGVAWSGGGFDVRQEITKYVALVKVGAQPKRTKKGYPAAIANWLRVASRMAAGGKSLRPYQGEDKSNPRDVATEVKARAEVKKERNAEAEAQQARLEQEAERLRQKGSRFDWLKKEEDNGPR